MQTFLSILRKLVIGRTGFVFEIFICELMFTLPADLRKFNRIGKFSYLSIPLAIAAHFCFGFFVPYFNRVTLVIFGVSVLLIWGVFKLPIKRAIFNCIAAYAAQNLGVSGCQTFNKLFGITGNWTILTNYLLTAAIYAVCYFAFAKKVQKKDINIKLFYLLAIGIITVLITNVLYWYLNIAVNGNIMGSATMIICCVLALLLQYNAFRSATLNKDRAITEELLRLEQKQHALSQESIDLINIKSHDLKKTIRLVRESLGDKADEILGDVERVVRNYDSFVETGNKNLDLVINEEKQYCDRHGITLEIIAEGEALDFMDAVDIYSLFDNVLKNAIESVSFEEEDKRNIRLDVHTKNKYVCIEVSNFCSRHIEIVDGRPKTSKSDKRFHGFGIRSMEYIVEKYGGNMVIAFNNNLFTVKIIIKIPS